MSFHLADPCLWCIEGSSPAGVHHIIGPVYKPCPECLPICPDCAGTAVFPADFVCIGCFQGQMATLGLVPAFCPGCSGVAYLVRTDTLPEVTPHADH
ncbi:hypothetical protein [Plantactinospora sp. BB1]|uniref:hypothetical protein n=1 Tax=Plantactinospora sp. BB1 TaxID=2071627 RepID=UPI000D166629|nr:hypothetical protein [Plantactinospora sp. BB1]AVT38013.1 hypothetical protein C6W10_17960 [Plantactinospora sp. BB1]